MHRFRKKSETRRGGTVDPFYEPHASRGTQQQQDSLPLLPASDFRTSLILPGLTRRFSVLRNSSGEPIGLDEIKSKLAEQRARGSENRVSEEEEDMILEALSRLRTKGSTSRADATAASRHHNGDAEGERVLSGYTDSLDGQSRISAAPSFAGGQSVRSATSTNSALHGSPSITSVSSGKGSQVSRRMSNNLFGSGKFQDHTYIRTAYHRRAAISTTTRSSSVKHSESNTSMSTITSSRIGPHNSMYSDTQSLRPTTPDGSSQYGSSAPSSPNRAAYLGEFDGDVNPDLSRALSPEVLGRASSALDEAIKELEEEGDDEILMERSPVHTSPLTRPGTLSQAMHDPSPLASSLPTSPADSEAGMAVSSDERVASDEQRASPFPRGSTTSPTPRLPGYIPGMPRPMTPRDFGFDVDDQTPSATPRATSPRLPAVNHQPLQLSQSVTSGVYSSNSNSSTTRTTKPASPAAATPVSTSPLFFHRSTNGRFTPEDRLRNGSESDSPFSSFDLPDSPTIGRRRPISPLSGSAFQSMTPVSGSRPTTPSNIIWNTSSTSNGTSRGHGRNGSGTSGHSRSGSNASTTEGNGESRLTTRSLRSPGTPDPSWPDSRHASSTSLTMYNVDYRPSSAMSGTEVAASPAQAPNRPFRSPTPTHNATYSPVSATFADQGVHVNGNGSSVSRHTSKQNGHSSFSFTASQALLFSPVGNSSRSSLESAGSSYHSWDEDHRKDRVFDLFSSLDPQPEWHDISTQSSSSRTTPYGKQDPAEVVRLQLGLDKTDLAAIQDKLVSVALTKAATPEGRHRANSVRRRRPSTSQSNYSFTGEKASGSSQTVQASAPALASTLTYPNRQVNSEQLAKANALLDSVVDSIQSPRSKTVNLANEDESLAVPAHGAEVVITNPSPSQKHRALADALFGTEGRNDSEPVSQSAGTVSTAVPVSPMEDHEDTRPQDMPSDHVVVDQQVLLTPNGGVSSPRTGSSLHSESSRHVDPTLLALDVQRRAEAATAALRKSPSIPKLPDSSGSTRKRIARSQISSPTLMSASTSVDTIPLHSITATQSRTPQPPTSTLGARIKRLRGTLRARPQGGPDTEANHPSGMKTPPSAQTITFNPLSPEIVGKDQSIPGSANEFSQFKVSPPLVSSPPASAGPGLKGFMSRFRKQRPAEMSPHRREPTLSPSTTISSALTSTQQENMYDSTSFEAHSAPASRTLFSGTRPQSPAHTLSPSFSSSPSVQDDTPVPASAPATAVQPGEAALKQLFDAAHDLGLDQAALNELLARSPSAASKSTAWTKVTRSDSVSGSRQSQPAELRDSIPSPLPSDGRPSAEAISSRPSAEIRQLTIRKNGDASQAARSTPGGSDPRAIVRRTIIIPSDAKATMELSALMRKQSSRRRQSVGAASLNSVKSVQDRVPTPPPHRSNAAKRFSGGRSPPVPNLPPSFSALAEGVTAPTQMEKSNSTYDSLYEMYAGDSRTPSAAFADGHGIGGGPAGQGDTNGETGPAVEVIELASGETIWSIVNGLRDDDTESFYDNRASFTSEYSAEGVRVFFKEHGRKNSKSSNTSLLSRKKPQNPSSQRPETKVFFSSSAQIDRLIETLTRDKEAGSFNIAPERHYEHPGHSASSSLGSTTDMLERMLGSMSNTS
ncbi:hypothetical protein BDW22DRAFT_1360638 [Trametopsis cervina]|nr:hypothetical protein BDW22DRAFT_1360638 [Trametopsis cervina]